MSTNRPMQPKLHPAHGFSDNRLADGRRMLSGYKRIRPGARSTVLIWPTLFRLDVTSNEDSQALALRPLAGHKLRGGPGGARTRTLMGIDGRYMKVSDFDFELVDSGLGPVSVALCMPATSVGWADLDCGAVAYVPPDWPQRK